MPVHAQYLPDASRPIRLTAIACAIVALLSPPGARAQVPPSPTILPVMEAVSPFGQAQANTSADGKTLNVRVNASRAVIGWKSFTTSADGTVRFSSDPGAAVLNIITPGTQPTAFYGKLEAQGPALYIFDKAGFMFMNGSSVRTDSHFLVSDGGVSNSLAFLDGEAWNVSASGAGSGVSLQGDMQVGGHMVAIGTSVTASSTSVIRAAKSVAFYAGGDNAKINFADRSPLLLTPVGGRISGPAVGWSAVGVAMNQGFISAGDSVLIAGRVAYNRQGTIFANQAVGGQNGSVTLLGDEVASHRGNIVVDGSGGVVNIQALTADGRAYTQGSITAERRIDISGQALSAIDEASEGKPVLTANLVRLGSAFRYGAADDGSAAFSSYTDSQSDLPVLQSARRIDFLAGTVNANAFTAAASQLLIFKGTVNATNVAMMSREKLTLTGNIKPNGYGQEVLLGAQSMLLGEPDTSTGSAVYDLTAFADPASVSTLAMPQASTWLRDFRSVRLEASDRITLQGTPALNLSGSSEQTLTLRAGTGITLNTVLRPVQPFTLNVWAGDASANNPLTPPTAVAGVEPFIDARGLDLQVKFSSTRDAVSLAVTGPGLIHLPSASMSTQPSIGGPKLVISAPDGSFELNGDLTGVREVSLSGGLRATKDSTLNSNGALSWTLPTTGPLAVGPAGGAYVDLISTYRALGTSIHQYAGRLDEGANVLVTLDGLKDGAQYGDVTVSNLGEQVLHLSGADASTASRSSLVVPGLVTATSLASQLGGRLEADAYSVSDTGAVRFDPTALNRTTAPHGALYALGNGVASFTIRKRLVDVSGPAIQAVFGEAVVSLPSLSDRFFTEDGINLQWKYTDTAGQAQDVPETLGVGGYALSPLMGYSINNKNYQVTGSRRLEINARPLTVTASSSAGVFMDGATPYLQYDGQIRGYRPDLALTYQIIGSDGARYANLNLAPAGAYKLSITASGHDAANYAVPASLDYTVLPLRVGFTDVLSSFNYGLNQEVCTLGVCDMRPLTQPLWRLTGIGTNALQQLGSDLRIELRAVGEGTSSTALAVDANLPVGRYRLEPYLGGRFASSIDLQAPSVTSLQVQPYLLHLDIDRNLYYGAQNGVSDGGSVYMTPSGRPPVRLATSTPLRDAAFDYTLKDASDALLRYQASMNAGTYAIVPQLSGTGSANYAFYAFDPALEIRKAVVGYRIDGGLGQYLMGQGFLGAKGGTAQLNGVLDGDTVGIVTAVWPGTNLGSKDGDPILNLATAKPGDYHFQALALYANANNYVLGAPGGSWGAGAALTVRPSTLIQPTLLGQETSPAATPSGTQAANSASDGSSSTPLSKSAAGSVGVSTSTSTQSDGVKVEVSARTGTSGEAKAGLSGVQAKGEVGAGVALTLTSGPTTVEANAGATLQGQAGVGLTNVNALAVAGLQATISDTVKGNLGNGVDGAASAKVQVFAGERAEAKAGYVDGKLQAKSEAQLGTFSSVNLSGQVEGSAGGIGASTTVFTPGALGMTAGGSVGYEDGKVAVNVSLGGAIGIGGLGVDINVKLDVGALKSAGEAVGSFFSDTFSSGRSNSSTPVMDSVKNDMARYIGSLDPMANPKAYVAAVDRWAQYSSLVDLSLKGNEPARLLAGSRTSATDINRSVDIVNSISRSYKAAKAFEPALAEANLLRIQQAELVTKIRTRPQSVTMADIQALMSTETRALAALKAMDEAGRPLGRTVGVDQTGHILVTERI